MRHGHKTNGSGFGKLSSKGFKSTQKPSTHVDLKKNYQVATSPDPKRKLNDQLEVGSESSSSDGTLNRDHQKNFTLEEESEDEALEIQSAVDTHGINAEKYIKDLFNGQKDRMLKSFGLE